MEVFEPITEKRLLIGIDCGVKTGYAVYDQIDKKLVAVETRTIISAMQQIRFLIDTVAEVRIEDARLRKWFGNAGKERLQGVGSVKRDSAIWEEFCEYYCIPYKLIHPKDNMTKTTAEYFRKLTGWEKRTSVHARDAAALCIGG